jgi:hypothetical protein
LFLRAFAFSLLKETLAFNMRLLYLDERARSWGPPVNFNPPCQLHPSSPLTSTLVAIQIPNPVAVLFPPILLDGRRGVLDAAAAR